MSVAAEHSANHADVRSHMMPMMDMMYCRQGWGPWAMPKVAAACMVRFCQGIALPAYRFQIPLHFLQLSSTTTLQCSLLLLQSPYFLLQPRFHCLVLLLTAL